ncbi:MAG: hypothetical protein HY291_12540 [Planctomycetes bacterium]|nr:hypothetical protein [Planctomycetota bacterium]
MRFQRVLPLLLAGVLLLTLFCLPAEAGGGGCPMCKAAANSLGEDGQRALNYGIVMMMIPVALVFGTFGYLLFKRRQAAQRT